MERRDNGIDGEPNIGGSGGLEPPKCYTLGFRDPEEPVVMASVLATGSITGPLYYFILNPQVVIDNPQFASYAATAATAWFSSIAVGGIASAVGLYRAFREGFK